MKRIKKSLMMACVAAALLTSTSLLAQPAPGGGGQGGGPGGPGGGPGGNFDPTQMRQRMAEMMRERLEVTNDDEWKVLQERIEKVRTLRQEAGGGGGFGGMGGMGMMRPRNNNNDAAGAGGNQPRRFGGPEPTPEVAALQKALDGKASTEELKTKLASLREARKASAAKLEKAQDDLRKLVNVRQEAQLVLVGVLQ